MKQARRHFLEQLEPRNLMAVNILSVSPADGAVNWPLNTDLTITFDTAVVKGQGNIHVVREDTGTLGVAIDVNSTNVSISGSTVTVDIPENLLTGQAYRILIDNGTFLDTTTAPTSGATLLAQDFELLPLLPFATVGGGDGTDFTHVPPLNFVVDNSLMATGGVPEYVGWTFFDKGSWIREAGQSRDAFTLGQGTVAVGDPDQFDDVANGGAFNGRFVSRPIKLTGVTPGSVVLEFDSSFRPEDSQIGTLDVSFDGGTWVNLLTLNPSNTTNTPPSAGFINRSINEHLTSGVNTAVSGDGLGNAPFSRINNPVGASSMQLRWGVVGQNDWWWAVDNLKITGQVTGTPFLGVSSPTFWNLDIPRLTLAIDKASMSENGGSAIGTVSRNGAPTGNLVVTLASSDLTEATVPGTVTILNGQSSATFAITAVDDTISDRTQIVTISATASTFALGSSTINVLDDEGPKVVSLSPADNAIGVDYKSNLVITTDVPIRKGSGLINIIRTTGNVVLASLDVNSSAITISGNVVTIDPPVNLNGLTDFYVLVDDGALVDATLPALPSAAFLLQQSFGLTLSGTTAPTGFSVTGGGWNFIDKSTFVALGGSSSFAGQGTVAVTTVQDSFLRTTPIDLTGVTAGSVVLEFDASYAGGLPKLGAIQRSIDGGASWVDIAQFSANTPNTKVVISSSGVTGATPLGAPFSNPTSGSLLFRFGQIFNTGGYLAIDNLKITGEIQGSPFQGFQAADEWNFTTAVAPTLTVTIDKTSMNENGGSAIGTVTRNLSTAAGLTALLSSSDTTEATVPGSVTIPAGQSSVTFAITAVDDLLADGNQTVVISASFVDFFSVPASIVVVDDDFPKVNALSPADNATAAPVAANLVVTFDQAVKKGNGFVHIIRASDGKSAQSIDIQSSTVTISGSVVTINPPANLANLTNYYVAFEDGAILSTLSSVKPAATLLSQDFELLTLRPAVFETNGLTPNGRDWTPTPPAGYAVDNSLMPAGGIPEWTGWTFAAKSFWETQGGQNRANFTRGQGTIAVGDTDEWEDFEELNTSFNSLFRTSPVNLSQVVAGTVSLEFDSSFRPEDSSATNNQVGVLEVSYNGGTTWDNLFTYDFSNTGSAATAPNVNERKVVSVPNPSTGNMTFRFGLTGTNDWWWAIDNVKVTGDVNGLPYPGIANNDASTWNFTTADDALAVALPTSVAENAGTVTATLSRNVVSAQAEVVTLTSSDPLLATVPTTVTIPANAASVSFAITVLDDSNFDGLKNVMISAASANLFTGVSTLSITDNEVGNVVISEIMYNPFGTEPRTEWMEVYNAGATTADLGNWSFDDEDTSNWGAIPVGTLLAPGQVGVIYSSFFGTYTEAIFRAEWNVPAAAVVRSVLWGELNNSPLAGGANPNENIVLRDASNTILDTVNYDDAGIWPAAADGPSIYLRDAASDNNVGSNWARSLVGTDGAVNPTGPTYVVGNIGSPGRVPSNASTISTRGLVYVGATGSSASGSLATDKTALLPGQPSTFANYTSYSRGLNGVVVDVNSLPSGTTNAQMLASLQFAQWDGIAVGGFGALSGAAVPTATIVSGGGAGGSARVTITFPDNTVQNTWLRVTVLANANTGLAVNDVFYFGNVIGELNIGNTATRLRVNGQDAALILDNQSPGANSAGVTNIFDLDRNGRVNGVDYAILLDNQQAGGIVAPITAPSPRPAALSKAFSPSNGIFAFPFEWSLSSNKSKDKDDWVLASLDAYYASIWNDVIPIH